MADPAPNAIPSAGREGPPEDLSARRARERRRKVFTLQVLILATAGAIVVMLLWIRPIPRPRFLPLWVARYRAPQVPTVPMAEPDLKLVTERSAEKAADALDRRGFSDGLLDRFKALGAVDSVVVYVRANACAGVKDAATLKAAGDDPGRVLILPDDADPNAKQNWVELRGVLEGLRDHCRARRKLLVLDIMPPLTDPRLGILADDVAARVKAELDAVKDARRLTFCASSPGQVALASEELGRSVFNHYLEEGLRGWADVPSGTRGRDGIVTAHELARYVALHVDRWARRNRDAHQTPFLHGNAREIPLVVLARNRPLPHVTVPEPKSYPDWLLAAWHLRDQWWTDQSYRTAPWAVPAVGGERPCGRAATGEAGSTPARIDEERIGPLPATGRATARGPPASRSRSPRARWLWPPRSGASPPPPSPRRSTPYSPSGTSRRRRSPPPSWKRRWRSPSATS